MISFNRYLMSSFSPFIALCLCVLERSGTQRVEEEKYIIVAIFPFSYFLQRSSGAENIISEIWRVSSIKRNKRER